MSVRLPPDFTQNSRVVPPPLRVASVTPRIVIVVVMVKYEEKVMTFDVATSMSILPSSIAELSSPNEVTEHTVVGASVTVGSDDGGAVMVGNVDGTAVGGIDAVGAGDGSRDTVGAGLVVGDGDGAALGWSSVSVRAVEYHEPLQTIVQVPDGGAAAVLTIYA